MVISIFANPDQTVAIPVQTTDGYGSRVDGYQAPQIDFVLDPLGVPAAGFPAAMTKITAGVYSNNIVIPSGASAVGSYIVSVSWPHPTTSHIQSELYLINVSLPFGNSSVSPA